MSELRPIGSEVLILFPPSATSTRRAWTLWRYRVGAHAKCIKAAMTDTFENVRPFGEPYMAETLEPIESEEVQATEWYWDDIGRLTPRKPDRFVNYQTGVARDVLGPFPPPPK